MILFVSKGTFEWTHPANIRGEEKRFLNHPKRGGSLTRSDLKVQGTAIKVVILSFFILSCSAMATSSIQ